jgi:hypothetical protein
MSVEFLGQFETGLAQKLVDVTIVMPCLNEAGCLAICIANAREALDMIEQRFGLVGEIVVADNGSSDGSQAIATASGARVEPVAIRGYGAAMIGGALSARGHYIVFGDADGSYDFRESCDMIGALVDGAELCMGSRFKGGIARGAMPWKNRYIGNPVLTGVLNLMFRSGVSDAHCGLRAVTRDTFLALRLSGTGMEFASEMVIKAALQKKRIVEVPATLSCDLRDREPHLRPWRDGWRHLRYLFMLSPTWMFALPSLTSVCLGLLILAGALLGQAGLVPVVFGGSWTMLAGAMVGLGHLGLIMALASHLYGVRSGFRAAHPGLVRVAALLNLEVMLVSGLALASCGGVGLVAVAAQWSASGYVALQAPFWPVAAIAAVVTGVQNVFGGFLLAVIGGNDADFLKAPQAQPAAPAFPGIEALHDRAA